MKTKDKILITALSLFNNKGTAKVTTNHIADAMGISPGNLYYHYRNKEEIILRLWETMVSKIHIPFTETESPEPAGILVQFLHDFFDIVYDYRFFWLEMAVLLEKDPVLKERYITRARNLLTRYKESVRIWRHNGFLRSDISETSLDQMIETTWFLSQFWALNTYIHHDRITRENMSKGALHIVASMKPYLNPEVLAQMLL